MDDHLWCVIRKTDGGELYEKCRKCGIIREWLPGDNWDGPPNAWGDPATHYWYCDCEPVPNCGLMMMKMALK